jgi:hypothetical protein
MRKRGVAQALSASEGTVPSLALRACAMKTLTVRKMIMTFSAARLSYRSPGKNFKKKRRNFLTSVLHRVYRGDCNDALSSGVGLRVKTGSLRRLD